MKKNFSQKLQNTSIIKRLNAVKLCRLSINVILFNFLRFRYILYELTFPKLHEGDVASQTESRKAQ